MTRLFLPGRAFLRKEPLGPDAQRRLRNETAMLERLRGVQGVAQLLEAPRYPGSIVLADAGGISLAGLAKPLAVDELIGLAVELARVVAGMHRRGVMHRDITPTNIVLSGDGTPCLVDFAQATSLAEVRPDFTHHSEIVGTLAYRAPEQTGRTGRSVDQRADLYALGATLYELATGEPPFGIGDPLRLIHDHLARVPVPPAQVNPAIPRAMSEIVIHLLEKEPDHRYQTAEGLIHDLERVRDAQARPAAAPVRIGEHDVPPRLLPPSRLVGRDAGDPLTAQVRAQRVGVDVLRAVASRKRPVVLFVDDLQWAGRTQLGFVDLVLSEEPVEGLLLVGAYRDGDVDAAHPLAPLLSRWREDARVQHLRLDNLPISGSVTMVVEMLHVDPAAAAGLVAVIRPHMAGNPYETVELLDALRREGLLTVTTGGWRWDAAAVRTHLGRSEGTELLAARVEAMPPPSRAMVEAMACLGGRAERSLLQVATGDPASAIEQALAPALEEGVLVVEPGTEEAVRFRHDRIREAVLGRLDPERLRALQLAMARRLAGVPELFAVAAEQYVPVADAVHEAAERRLVAGLLRCAADQAALIGDYALVNRTVFGRYLFAVGGNAEAAELSGVRVDLVRAGAFIFSGLAAGVAAAIAVSRISSGQPLAGTGLELQAIAAVILGGTSIYGGVGAVWRSLAGVYLLALINNGFNILNANPFYKDLTTGVIIVSAVALSAAGRRRR